MNKAPSYQTNERNQTTVKYLSHSLSTQLTVIWLKYKTVSLLHLTPSVVTNYLQNKIQASQYGTASPSPSPRLTPVYLCTCISHYCLTQPQRSSHYEIIVIYCTHTTVSYFLTSAHTLKSFSYPPDWLAFFFWPIFTNPLKFSYSKTFLIEPFPKPLCWLSYFLNVLTNIAITVFPHCGASVLCVYVPSMGIEAP